MYVWIPLKSLQTLASITNVTIYWVDTQTCATAAYTCISWLVLHCLLAGQIGNSPVHRGWFPRTNVQARFLGYIHRHLLFVVLNVHKPLIDTMYVCHLMFIIESWAEITFLQNNLLLSQKGTGHWCYHIIAGSYPFVELDYILSLTKEIQKSLMFGEYSHSLASKKC